MGPYSGDPSVRQKPINGSAFRWGVGSSLIGDSTMKIGTPIDIKITLRDYDFNRQFAIRDVYDVLVELITNSDDIVNVINK